MAAMKGTVFCLVLVCFSLPWSTLTATSTLLSSDIARSNDLRLAVDENVNPFLDPETATEFFSMRKKRSDPGSEESMTMEIGLEMAVDEKANPFLGPEIASARLFMRKKRSARGSGSELAMGHWGLGEEAYESIMHDASV